MCLSFEVPVVVVHIVIVCFEHEEYADSEEDWWECHRDHKYCFHLSLLFAHILVVVLHSQMGGVEDDESRCYYK
jgi:hypothetical protein